MATRGTADLGPYKVASLFRPQGCLFLFILKIIVAQTKQVDT